MMKCEVKRCRKDGDFEYCGKWICWACWNKLSAEDRPANAVKEALGVKDPKLERTSE